MKNTSYTPPSPIKATPTSIASDSNDVSTASVSKAGDIMMTSSDQKGNLLNSLTPKSVPAGAKKILFGRYVLNIYVGIVRYFLR